MRSGRAPSARKPCPDSHSVLCRKRSVAKGRKEQYRDHADQHRPSSDVEPKRCVRELTVCRVDFGLSRPNGHHFCIFREPKRPACSATMRLSGLRPMPVARQIDQFCGVAEPIAADDVIIPHRQDCPEHLYERRPETGGDANPPKELWQGIGATLLIVHHVLKRATLPR